MLGIEGGRRNWFQIQNPGHQHVEFTRAGQPSARSTHTPPSWARCGVATSPRSSGACVDGAAPARSMSHELVVRGGTVVTAEASVCADVGVDGGRVSALAPSLPAGRREIDATGLLVLPGGVDVHTHLDAEVGGVRAVDDFESGTAAAACGGVTTICD